MFCVPDLTANIAIGSAFGQMSVKNSLYMGRVAGEWEPEKRTLQQRTIGDGYIFNSF